MSLPLVFGTEDELFVGFDPDRRKGGHILPRDRDAYLAEADFYKERLLMALQQRFYRPRTEEAAALVAAAEREAYAQGSLWAYYMNTMTPSGARFYPDHRYVEYSSPECRNPFQLVAVNIAHEEMIRDEFERLFADDPACPVLYKNVSDGGGHSQGAHRNFCIPRWLGEKICGADRERSVIETGTEGLSREGKIFATWCVVASLYEGAGAPFQEVPCYAPFFQIAGRPQFLRSVRSCDTLFERALINTRDEPLANCEKYSRLHCITGDANRSEWSQLFRIGLPAIVLGMLASGECPVSWYVAEPLHATRVVAGDPTLQVSVDVISFITGEMVLKPVFEILEEFLSAMRRYCARGGVPSWCGTIFAKAEEVAPHLKGDARVLENLLDWKIKERLFREMRNPSPAKQWLLHARYHALSGKRQIYQELLERGAVLSVIPRGDVERAKQAPPPDTRAYCRGMLFGRFPDSALFRMPFWDRVLFCSSADLPDGAMLLMPEPCALTRDACGSILEQEGLSLPVVLRRLTEHGAVLSYGGI